MAIKATVVSTKGGVGKTTLTANLGAALADLGQRVLMVDIDVQPTLSSYYPVTERAKYGLTHLLNRASVWDVVSKTSIQGLDLIYSDDFKGELENWLLHQPDGRVRLKQLLVQYDDQYDFILIDTQGAIGPLQDAGVLAADLLISPIPPEMMSAREFARGTIAMIERLLPMAALGAPVGPLRGIIYRADNTRDCREISSGLTNESFKASKGSITILETIVPATVVYRAAATAQEPVHRFERSRKGPTLSARETMLSLIHELFPYLKGESFRDEVKGMPLTGGAS